MNFTELFITILVGFLIAALWTGCVIALPAWLCTRMPEWIGVPLHVLWIVISVSATLAWVFLNL